MCVKKNFRYLGLRDILVYAVCISVKVHLFEISLGDVPNTFLEKLRKLVVL